MILSGSMPNDLRAGGKIIPDELIHIDTPPLRIMADTMPAINPPEADTSSAPLQKNLCIAPKGNEALGKAPFINPRPPSKPILPAAGLYPCKGRISYLAKGDVVLEMAFDKENGMHHWNEVGTGETELATQLGELIECCPDHK